MAEVTVVTYGSSIPSDWYENFTTRRLHEDKSIGSLRSLYPGRVDLTGVTWTNCGDYWQLDVSGRLTERRKGDRRA